MKLTEEQKKLYCACVDTLEAEQLIHNQPYSGYAIRELNDSYELYKQIEHLEVEQHECTENELWLALSWIPIVDDTLKTVEQIGKNISEMYIKFIKPNQIMQSIIRLQIATGIKIDKKYYAIFLEWFSQLYLEVITKKYHDPYQKKRDKQLTQDRRIY